MINFDPTFRGRKEVQKNKWTPYFLTEFHGESENNSRFSPREPSFRPKMFFKKTALNKFNTKCDRSGLKAHPIYDLNSNLEFNTKI